MVNKNKKSFGEVVGGEETLPAPKEPLPRFRAHFRTSSNGDKQHMDVAAENTGDVHEQVREYIAKHDKDCKVFIDKVKLLSS